MDSGHTAWMLTATALVFFMTPGLAFFYGGLVRAKNLVNTIMLSFISIAVVSIVWVLRGYSLAFGAGNAYIGDFSHIGLHGVSFTSGAGDDIPPLLFVAFQMMFAIITPALITGAFAERFKFNAKIDTYSNTTEVAQGENRVVKTTFGLSLQGYGWRESGINDEGNEW